MWVEKEEGVRRKGRQKRERGAGGCTTNPFGQSGSHMVCVVDCLNIEV